MTHTAVDGDISDFIDSMIEVTDEFRTVELRQYLLNAGHTEADALDAIRSWQGSYSEQLDPHWETFQLTAEGRVAVEELRNRLD